MGAQEQVGGASSTQGFAASFLPLVLIFIVFYFFLIRPQSKKQKEMQNMLAQLKKGDKVITIGGIHGSIFSIDEKTVVLKVDDNTKIKFNRSAISALETENVPSAKDSKKESKKDAKKIAEDDSAKK